MYKLYNRNLNFCVVAIAVVVRENTTNNSVSCKVEIKTTKQEEKQNNKTRRFCVCGWLKCLRVYYIREKEEETKKDTHQTHFLLWAAHRKRVRDTENSKEKKRK